MMSTTSSNSHTLVIGASRGLGLALVHYLAKEQGKGVIASFRSSKIPEEELFHSEDSSSSAVKTVTNIDMADEECGQKLVNGIQGVLEEEEGSLEAVYLVSGILKPEESLKPNYQAQVEMYKVCAIGPCMALAALADSKLLAKGAKVIFVTSEAGSLGLRTESEGGAMYGHHASKSAANMVGRLLSFDLKKKGVALALIHPGFLRTEMTKGAGFDEFYESGGAITPEEACPGIVKFAEGFRLERSGEFWAPNGPKGIGGFEEVCGKEAAQQTGPVKIPW